MRDQFLLVDCFVLLIIGLSVLLGFWRGFLREAISLATWITAFVLAFLLVGPCAAYLEKYIPVPEVRLIVAFGSLFLITLFLGGLVNIIVSQIVQNTGLSGRNRLTGLILGGIRGAGIVLIMVLLAGLTPLPQEPWWRQSLFLPHFENLALWLRDFLPAPYVEYLDFTPESVLSSPARDSSAI